MHARQVLTTILHSQLLICLKFAINVQTVLEKTAYNFASCEQISLLFLRRVAKQTA